MSILCETVPLCGTLYKYTKCANILWKLSTMLLPQLYTRNKRFPSIYVATWWFWLHINSTYQLKLHQQLRCKLNCLALLETLVLSTRSITKHKTKLSISSLPNRTVGFIFSHFISLVEPKQGSQKQLTKELGSVSLSVEQFLKLQSYHSICSVLAENTGLVNLASKKGVWTMPDKIALWILWKENMTYMDSFA